MSIEIHNLAVLRAAVEGVHLGSYFGSFGALKHWIASTQSLGWIDVDEVPTDAGLAVAKELELSSQEAGRAYLWGQSCALMEKAKKFELQKQEQDYIEFRGVADLLEMQRVRAVLESKGCFLATDTIKQIVFAVKPEAQPTPGEQVTTTGAHAAATGADGVTTGATGSQLKVWFGPMPESNGKSNWTAILYRGDITRGFTLARSEFKDRVRYSGDRVRYLLGELTEQPNILDYDENLMEDARASS